MSSIQEFWKGYTTYPENTHENVEQYAAFHPADIAHLKENYPHFFEEITHLKGRKLQERLKFERHLFQVNGMFVLDDNKAIVKNEQHIHIWTPEPYAGNLEQAKLLILLVNPAFHPLYHPSDEEKRIKFDNLHIVRPNYAPYEFRDGKLSNECSLTWHYDHMYQYIERDIGYFHPNQLFTLQYYAYPSLNRDDVTFYSELLPSQVVAIATVREAMDKNLNIIARCTDRTRWFAQIPELTRYDKLFVFTNFKQPSLHPDEIMRYETFRRREILMLKNQLKDARKEDWKLLIKDIKAE